MSTKKITYIKYAIFSSLVLLQSFWRISNATNLDRDPRIGDLLNLVVYVINLAILSGAIIFVAMVAYGAWKSSMALGDPRGLDAAKKTWTYAMYGILVILGATSLFIIIAKLTGASVTPSLMRNEIGNALQDLYTNIVGP